MPHPDRGGLCASFSVPGCVVLQHLMVNTLRVGGWVEVGGWRWVVGGVVSCRVGPRTHGDIAVCCGRFVVWCCRSCCSRHIDMSLSSCRCFSVCRHVVLSSSWWRRHVVVVMVLSCFCVDLQHVHRDAVLNVTAQHTSPTAHTVNRGNMQVEILNLHVALVLRKHNFPDQKRVS